MSTKLYLCYYACSAAKDENLMKYLLNLYQH